MDRIDTDGARRPRLLGLTVESEAMLHLDALRFVAACAIVLCHSLEFLWPRAERASAAAIAGPLALFVDVFFVISGYVISFVYRDKFAAGYPFASFIKRRIGRLFPLHLVTLAAAVVLALAIARVGIPMAHPPSLTLGCLTSNALLLHAVLPCSGYPISGVTWSLSAEMVMYLCFPAIVALAARGASAVFALAAVSFVVVLWLYGFDAPWASHLNLGRAVPAFLLGVGCYLVRDRLGAIPKPSWLMAATIVAFGIGDVCRLPDLVLLGMAYLIPVLAIAADQRRRTPIIVRRVAPLGQLTYSIYMLHGLVILVVANGIGDKMLKLGPAAMAGLLLLTYAIILATSLISYRYWETPARRYIDAIRLPAARRASTAAPGER